MASRRQLKRRAKRRAQARGEAPPKLERPTPVQAVELHHQAQADRWASRPDRFSQLLARAFNDEHSGQNLMTRSGLTTEERAELASLRDEAHAMFGKELADATLALRAHLGKGDPLYIVALVQAMNLMTPWGSYYEPTHPGRENRVELIAGLLASQAPSQSREAPTSAEMQQIFDEVEHILDVLYLFNFSMPRADEPEIATLRFTSAMHWLNLRGSSFADHGEELARSLFSPHDPWLVETYGFNVSDLISAGRAIDSLTHRALNALLKDAGEFADGVVTHLADPSSRKRLPAAVRASTATADGREAAARFAFMDAFQSGIRDAATFTIDQLCAEVPSVPRAHMAAILSELSIQVGGVDPADYTGLFDPTPFVERPFLQLDDRYVVPVLGMLVRDTVALLDRRLIHNNPNYSRSRAKTLDRLAVGYLKSMLPGATAHANLFYDGTEIDGLVLFDGTAIIVEGKGSSISFQARRGDVRRLVKEIRDSVQAAWEQGARARDFILAAGDSVFLGEDAGHRSRIPPGF